ncbi:MAG: GIY-YIG nuclease family protein, partial [Gammaproteobacteria bacterium]
MNDWYIYLVRTRLGTLYTGISTDVPRRLSEHEGNGKGAKYLRSKG